MFDVSVQMRVMVVKRLAAMVLHYRRGYKELVCVDQEEEHPQIEVENGSAMVGQNAGLAVNIYAATGIAVEEDEKSSVKNWGKIEVAC